MSIDNASKEFRYLYRYWDGRKKIIIETKNEKQLRHNQISVESPVETAPDRKYNDIRNITDDYGYPPKDYWIEI